MGQETNRKEHGHVRKTRHQHEIVSDSISESGVLHICYPISQSDSAGWWYFQTLRELDESFAKKKTDYLIQIPSPNPQMLNTRVHRYMHGTPQSVL